jgi:hypothetical protein
MSRKSEDQHLALYTLEAVRLVTGETDTCGDAGYQGARKRANTSPAAPWNSAMRWESAQQWTKAGAGRDDQLDRTHQGQHPFRVIKRQFGFVKVRYRGLNTAQLTTLFALSNLWIARGRLLGAREALMHDTVVDASSTRCARARPAVAAHRRGRHHHLAVALSVLVQLPELPMPIGVRPGKITIRERPISHRHAGPNATAPGLALTPAKKAKEGAMPHLGKVAHWDLADFRRWAEEALVVVRDLRRDFQEPGDLAWRAQAAQALSECRADAPGLAAWLGARPARDHLVVVP